MKAIARPFTWLNRTFYLPARIGIIMAGASVITSVIVLVNIL